MKTIKVSATTEYNVYIAKGILENIGDYAASVCHANKIAIISDSNVWPLYGGIVTKSIINAGFSVCHHILPAGEESKNGVNYLSILNFLAENRLTRTDCIIALGGGVVGDIAGFAAATYLRGISYIQVPTSLLAMVDSSVGGKTAIDLPAGKNLAGAFCQPKLVVCDLNTLLTLPENVFRDGCAEVIKYGVLFDAELFAHLSKNALSFDFSYVIPRCIELKRDIVEADEFEQGPRKLLNLGHTVGHSIEKLSNYQISHGFAVAAGMAIAARIASATKECDTNTADQICDILSRFSLPVNTEYSADDLYTVCLSDKKASADSVVFVMPNTVGHCSLKPILFSKLLSTIESGL